MGSLISVPFTVQHPSNLFHPTSLPAFQSPKWLPSLTVNVHQEDLHTDLPIGGAQLEVLG